MQGIQEHINEKMKATPSTMFVLASPNRPPGARPGYQVELDQFSGTMYTFT